MISENIVLVIDAGNTSIKVGHFQEDTLLSVHRFSHEEMDKFYLFLDENNSSKRVLSSVLSDKVTKNIVEKTNSFLVTTETSVPINIEYGTKNTLGVDRMCNAVATSARLKTEFGVSIDIGTCIKFDLVSKNDGYLGGSIAPGINLRYKALNDYTGKLPLLSNKSTTQLVGNDTSSSIQSGVLNGMNAEINGLIKMYSEQFSGLTFFMTGGDARYFDLDSKNDIFADENLTLIGLFEIFKHNG
jgi:type III pantothenate kinase